MSQPELRGVVALDGPSGTGKSTVARRLAAMLGAAYLDTGAMYRAVTLATLRAGIPAADVTALIRTAQDSDLTMGTDPDSPAVLLAGEDVAEQIRGPEVTGAVSAVSAVPQVRDVLVAHQRRVIHSASSTGGIVVEGRDIGTAVAPQAQLKVYLTASTHARAHRRNVQDAAAGHHGDVAQTRADVHRRDAFDSGRAASPLRMADDAVEIDTTELDVAGVLEQLRKLVELRGLLEQQERTV